MMEQAMQQHMEAAEHQYQEAQMIKTYRDHDRMANALSDILPDIKDTHPEIYLKYMGLHELVEEIKPRD